MVTRKAMDEQDGLMLRRQRNFLAAAKYVAAGFAEIPTVERVVLFGSVASPLAREVPRFRRFRRQGIEVFHECRDADLAVWSTDLSCLRMLQKARSLALNRLLEEKDVGVAHHQIDVFLMEPGTDRYLGRLCTYGKCPRGKDRCRVPGCGEVPFLRQHDGFAFNRKVLEPKASVVLYSRLLWGEV